ncbi:MAG: cellulase family glycosylhydrolase [Chitinispirillaceae bacterium]|nr:cellulase family glycosylhydrolase [Chitinispirillaceae bacterium]
MSKSLRIHTSIALLMFCAYTAFAAQPAKTIRYNGKDYYINGINVPWNSFGSDVGTHHEWGALYSPSFFTTFFQACKSSGVNCVRLWIHCDGRSSPEFDANGRVTGLDTNFLSDFDDLLRIACGNNVMVMPCLWSFDMTKDFTGTAGKYAGMHADLIQDTSKTRSYINNALIPMVKHLANASNLFAWEIINEPEWSISGPGNTVQLVSAREMTRFCAMIAEAIHLNCDKMVTVGSACLKWHSSRQPPADAHYWSDSAFKAAYNKPQAFLDFYQVHYYDWMFNADWGYDPFQTTKSTAYWKLDKPTIVGESPGKAGNYTVKQMVDNAFANGYAGIMPWSYNANDGHGSWNECKNELKAFRDAHASLVDFSCQTAVPRREISKPNRLMAVTINEGSTVRVFDIRGRQITAGNGGEIVRGLKATNGILLYQVRNSKNHITGIEKSAVIDRK